ncbi:hypothetical protein SODALDRAFT_355813 [Sodiomyces alkalinus F11]|uniref:Uncharacterized protein n=1 Tax=Sodiomyces alkalinus (strain CBS 110278 / VKM F-3762 / F11) TaxID=1314773 RepID=A0A3N2QAB4_SODAK|nr:hypothetical protein SODALDRAFT_355813 [Sodiomyces alkalinus F11]ROT43595.1 hypothetical protein SODALDRAFT_355813 [Sodiomyces alkalinus F11]
MNVFAVKTDTPSWIGTGQFQGPSSDILIPPASLLENFQLPYHPRLDMTWLKAMRLKEWSKASGTGRDIQIPRYTNKELNSNHRNRSHEPGISIVPLQQTAITGWPKIRQSSPTESPLHVPPVAPLQKSRQASRPDSYPVIGVVLIMYVPSPTPKT